MLPIKHLGSLSKMSLLYLAALLGDQASMFTKCNIDPSGILFRLPTVQQMALLTPTPGYGDLACAALVFGQVP